MLQKHELNLIIFYRFLIDFTYKKKIIRIFNNVNFVGVCRGVGRSKTGGISWDIQVNISDTFLGKDQQNGREEGTNSPLWPFDN